MLNAEKNISAMTMTDEKTNITADIVVYDLKQITFNRQKSKSVMPGEFFASDPIKLDFSDEEYLCLELTFSGKMIPFHEESLLPAYIKENDVWTYSKQMPFPGMIGCDRYVKARVAYLGDSITQGIGTAENSYLHWNALLSQKIGKEYSFWNLGIGYGRAADAASDGAWLYKAKQCDIIFVCYGVNDILNGRSEMQIMSDLTHIADILKKNSKKVVFQTIPPFDYTGENINKWRRLNSFIKTNLAERVDLVFDPVPYLGDSEIPSSAKFGRHPNEEGCRIWANALFTAIKEKNII